MESALEELYEKSYPNIQINKISILPRGYIESLDNDYVVVIKAKNNLNKSGIIYVKTNDNKKIFFDYDIDAKVSIYFARSKIDKGVELSPLNTVKKTVPLDKFRDMPIQRDDLSELQSKHAIKQDTIIGEKNVETIVLVKRGSNVNVKLNDESMAISFTAESLQNGKLGDIITVKKSDGKRLKATVIGKSRVEMR
jgi:flagella basal body P-ring formation protein FlgA